MVLEMKIKNFKTHVITRSSPPKLTEYSKYKPYLKKDFCGRCAYCNLSDDAITTSFEVDHFIPRKAFKDCAPRLETEYTNLRYSCKKCNGAKSNQFSGDLNVETPTNELFYDPVLVDYNDIFYRNELGAIDSDDDKGKNIIIRLKLYRPIHILAWICEELSETAEKLEAALKIEVNEERKNTLEQALNRINNQYRKMNHIFIAAYNDNSFSDENFVPGMIG